jgi:Formin Homology 2 Domain
MNYFGKLFSTSASTSTFEVTHPAPKVYVSTAPTHGKGKEFREYLDAKHGPSRYLLISCSLLNKDRQSANVSSSTSRSIYDMRYLEPVLIEVASLLDHEDWKVFDEYTNLPHVGDLFHLCYAIRSFLVLHPKNVVYFLSKKTSDDFRMWLFLSCFITWSLRKQDVMQTSNDLMELHKLNRIFPRLTSNSWRHTMLSFQTMLNLSPYDMPTPSYKIFKILIDLGHSDIDSDLSTSIDSSNYTPIIEIYQENALVYDSKTEEMYETMLFQYNILKLDLQLVVRGNVVICISLEENGEGGTRFPLLRYSFNSCLIPTYSYTVPQNSIDLPTQSIIDRKTFSFQLMIDPVSTSESRLSSAGSVSIAESPVPTLDQEHESSETSLWNELIEMTNLPATSMSSALVGIHHLSSFHALVPELRVVEMLRSGDQHDRRFTRLAIQLSKREIPDAIHLLSARSNFSVLESIFLGLRSKGDLVQLDERNSWRSELPHDLQTEQEGAVLGADGVHGFGPLMDRVVPIISTAFTITQAGAGGELPSEAGGNFFHLHEQVQRYLVEEVSAMERVLEKHEEEVNLVGGPNHGPLDHSVDAEVLLLPASVKRSIQKFDSKPLAFIALQIAFAIRIAEKRGPYRNVWYEKFKHINIPTVLALMEALKEAFPSESLEELSGTAPDDRASESADSSKPSSTYLDMIMSPFRVAIPGTMSLAPSSSSKPTVSPNGGGMEHEKQARDIVFSHDYELTNIFGVIGRVMNEGEEVEVAEDQPASTLAVIEETPTSFVEAEILSAPLPEVSIDSHVEVVPSDVLPPKVFEEELSTVSVDQILSGQMEVAEVAMQEEKHHDSLVLSQPVIQQEEQVNVQVPVQITAKAVDLNEDTEKFVKMLKMGVPVPAVYLRMENVFGASSGDILNKILESLDRSSEIDSWKLKTNSPTSTPSRMRKKLHWDTIPPDQIQDKVTIWSSSPSTSPSPTTTAVVDEKSIATVIDKEEIEMLFTAPIQNTSLVQGINSAPKLTPLAPLKPYLDVKRSRMIAIGIAKLKLSSPNDLIKFLSQYPSQFNSSNCHYNSSYTMDSLLILQEILPSKDEFIPLQDYFKKFHEHQQISASLKLNEAESFYESIKDIKNSREIVESIIFINSFSSKYQEIKQDIEILEKACGEIFASIHLQIVFDTIKQIGNIINDTKTVAFTLSSLSKLSITKTVDNKETLLEYLVRKTYDTNIVYLLRDLPSIFSAARIIPINIYTDVQILQSNLLVLKEHLEQTSFFSQANEKVDELFAKYEKALSEFQKVIAYFGDEETEWTPEALFGTLGAFITAMTKTNSDIKAKMKKLEMDQNRKQQMQMGMQQKIALGSGDGGLLKLISKREK